MKKEEYESEGYYKESGTSTDKEKKKEKHELYQREEIIEERYGKKSPSVIKYKGKLKRINE